MVWWGTPCTTYSRALKWDGGPTPLRDPCDPAEAGSWVTSPKQLLKVKDANTLTSITVEGSIVAHDAGACIVVENPERSLFWRVRSVIEMLDYVGAVKVLTHY